MKRIVKTAAQLLCLLITLTLLSGCILFQTQNPAPHIDYDNIDLTEVDFTEIITIFETVVDTKIKTLTPESDGYIHINAYDFHKLMNTVLRSDNYLNITRNDFIDEYAGKKFAISGTLKHNIATNILDLTVNDITIMGGAIFDYRTYTGKLGISDNRDYDNKDIIIRGTLTKFDRGDGLTDLEYTILN